MKRLDSHEQGARRLRSAGPALILAFTAAIVAIAWPTNEAADTMVDFSLDDTSVLAETQRQSLGSAAEPTLDSIRRRLDDFVRHGDSRQLRFAAAELTEWRTGSKPSAEVLTVTARIQQSRHQFEEAADTLERALALNGESIEAWLLYSDVQRRAGNIRDSRRACMQLALVSDATLAQYCALQVALLAGESGRAFDLSRRLLDEQERIDPEIRPWTTAVAADAALAAGHTGIAISRYRALLSTGSSTLASRLALSDLLLESNQARRAIAVLEGDRHLPAAQVRIAAAMHELGIGVDAKLIDRLDTLHAAATPAAADPLLLRDRALLELDVRGDADKALEFALANWAEQKSLRDLKLLRRAAAAAGNSNVPDELERWQKRVREGRI